MAQTFESIATYTATGSVATYTFSSIPATYTDLVLKIHYGAGAGEGLYFRLNGDTASNYSSTEMYATGVTQASQRRSTADHGDMNRAIASDGTNILGAISLDIFDYTNTTTAKTILARSSVGRGTYKGVDALTNSWRKTPLAAINSITIYSDSGGNFLVNSTFTIYGIKAA